MKNLNITIICLMICLLFGTKVQAQYKRFPLQGVITYEMKVNMYALLKRQTDEESSSSFMTAYAEEYKKKNAQFRTKKSTLHFNKNGSLLTQTADPIAGSIFSMRGTELFDQNNQVAKNFETGLATTQKKVFDENYLVKDSIPKITWKITDETRIIAGYECRRANALVMDSIYVVAFYTDLIPVSSGPESFSGLPGMILGLAIPYEHVTWFATEVKEAVVTDAQIAPPTKGKSINQSTLLKTLKDIFVGWGTDGINRIKLYFL